MGLTSYITMKTLLLFLAVLCTGAIAQKVSPKAASGDLRCDCQCASTTFRDKYNKIQGNCKSVDHTGARWCYVDQRYNRCTDLKTSQRFNQLWSYQACATPALNRRQCRRQNGGGHGSGGGHGGFGGGNSGSGHGGFGGGNSGGGHGGFGGGNSGGGHGGFGGNSGGGGYNGGTGNSCNSRRCNNGGSNSGGGGGGYSSQLSLADILNARKNKSKSRSRKLQ